MHPARLTALLHTAASTATCSRGQVGAVLLDQAEEVVWMAGNAHLPTDPSCDHDCRCVGLPGAAHHPQCPTQARCRNAVHAEMWCLNQLTVSRGYCDTWTLASTLAPCYRCAQLIVLAGVGRVAYIDDYREPDGLEILARAGIHAQRITGSGQLQPL